MVRLHHVSQFFPRKPSLFFVIRRKACPGEPSAAASRDYTRGFLLLERGNEKDLSKSRENLVLMGSHDMEQLG